MSKGYYFVKIIFMNIKIEREKIITYIIIGIGIILRVLYINRFPAGLNCDEASSVYEAYSIMTTLHDRNNIFMPVYLLSWGSGQNALLTYIMIPFVKLFGLNIWTTRLPMAIISSVSVIVFYKLLELVYDNESDKFIVFFGILFFTLNPWHIMKSRWGLESNLLPDIVLFGVYYLVKYFKSNKNLNIYISFTFFAISTYAYSTSFLALTLFTILLFIYGYVTKTIKFKQMLISAVIVLIIAWPLMLFVLINRFNLEEIDLIFLSIPKLTTNRLFTESIVNKSGIIRTLLENIFNVFKFFIIQDDNIYWNSISGIGMYYIFSFPFFVIGVLKLLVENTNGKFNHYKNLMFIWLISGLIMCLFISSINVNRANFVIIPIIYFIIDGFSVIFKRKTLKILVCCLISVSFALFIYRYIEINLDKEKRVVVSNADCFAVGYGELIDYLDKRSDLKELHLGGTVHEPHIYVLFYTKYDPVKFHNTKVLYSKKGNFNNVKSFGKWNFDLPRIGSMGLSKNPNVAYVFNDYLELVDDNNEFNIEKISNYLVVTYKGD